MFYFIKNQKRYILSHTLQFKIDYLLYTLRKGAALWCRFMPHKGFFIAEIHYFARIPSKHVDAQSQSRAETLEKSQNVFKVNIKDIRTYITPFLVFLLLTLLC